MQHSCVHTLQLLLTPVRIYLSTMIENVDMGNSIQVANAKQIENAQDSDTANKVSCHSTQVAAEEENVALPSNKRQMSSSSKSSSPSRATKLPKSSAKLSSSTRLRAETNATTNSKKSAGGLMDKKGVTQKSIHMSINFSSRLRDTNKSSLRVSKDRSAAPEISTKVSPFLIP